MSLKNLVKRFLRFPDNIGGPAIEYYQEEPSEEITLPPPVPAQERPGRIIKAEGHIQYSPDITRRGGRLVKAMPRELKQIKQAQEKTSE